MLGVQNSLLRQNAMRYPTRPLTLLNCSHSTSNNLMRSRILIRIRPLIRTTTPRTQLVASVPL